MEAKTEEFLAMLLWTCETLSRPSWRNLTESFEGWSYRRGLLRQLQRLEKQQLLERRAPHVGDRLYQLTETGRQYALGGHDPDKRWNRRWDGRWRLVLFDVPEARRTERDRLRRHLQGRGFGYLQNSVWITPDPVKEERGILRGSTVDVESLILFEARPCAGETDAEIVAGAWDFVDLNQRYAAHQAVLVRRPRHPIITDKDAHIFHHWLQEERETWMDAMWHDPLLPESLLPPGYAGRQAWRKRLETMTIAGEQMRSFHMA